MSKSGWFINSYKAITGLFFGKSIAPLNTFYDQRYPPTKFFKSKKNKIKIQCILCGFPRTGTHWIRNVIEKSTGKKTYNIYTQKPTPSDNDVLLLKIHARNKHFALFKALWLLPAFEFKNQYIYVYRDPRDSIISMYEMYKKSKNSYSLSAEKFFKIIDPIRQYRWEINSWVFHKHKNVLLVKYENLKLKPIEGFIRIFKYLDLSNPVSEEYISKIVCSSDKKKRPRGVAFGWKIAPAEYKYIIDVTSRKLAREIKLLGYGKGI